MGLEAAEIGLDLGQPQLVDHLGQHLVVRKTPVLAPATARHPEDGVGLFHTRRTAGSRPTVSMLRRAAAQDVLGPAVGRHAADRRSRQPLRWIDAGPGGMLRCGSQIAERERAPPGSCARSYVLLRRVPAAVRLPARKSHGHGGNQLIFRPMHPTMATAAPTSRMNDDLEQAGGDAADRRYSGYTGYAISRQTYQIERPCRTPCWSSASAAGRARSTDPPSRMARS